MKIVDVSEQVELSSPLAEVDSDEGELMIARNGLPIVAAIDTDEELAAEGWPI